MGGRGKKTALTPSLWKRWGRSSRPWPLFSPSPNGFSAPGRCPGRHHGIVFWPPANFFHLSAFTSLKNFIDYEISLSCLVSAASRPAFCSQDASPPNLVDYFPEPALLVAIGFAPKGGGKSLVTGNPLEPNDKKQVTRQWPFSLKRRCRLPVSFSSQRRSWVTIFDFDIFYLEENFSF